MDLRYLGSYDGADLRPLTFWCEPTRYDFEIFWEDGEPSGIFEREFRLNCEHQIGLGGGA